MKTLFIVIENGEDYVTPHGIRTSEEDAQVLLEKVYNECLESERKESAFPIAEDECRLNPEQWMGVVKHIMTDGSIGETIEFYLSQIDIDKENAEVLSKYLMSPTAES